MKVETPEGTFESTEACTAVEAFSNTYWFSDGDLHRLHRGSTQRWLGDVAGWQYTTSAFVGPFYLAKRVCEPKPLDAEVRKWMVENPREGVINHDGAVWLWDPVKYTFVIQHSQIGTKIGARADGPHVLVTPTRGYW